MNHYKSNTQIILMAILLSFLYFNVAIGYGMEVADNKATNSGEKEKNIKKASKKTQRKDLDSCNLIINSENEEGLNRVLGSILDKKNKNVLSLHFFKCVNKHLKKENTFNPSENILYRFYLAYSQCLIHLKSKDNNFWQKDEGSKILAVLIKDMSEIKPDSYFTLLTKSWFIKEKAYNLYGKTVEKNDKGRVNVVRYSSKPTQVQDALKNIEPLVAKAMKLRPNAPSAFLMMANIKKGQNDLNSAYHYFKRYIDNLPKSFPNIPINFGFNNNTFYSNKETRTMIYNSDKEYVAFIKSQK